MIPMPHPASRGRSPNGSGEKGGLVALGAPRKLSHLSKYTFRCHKLNNGNSLLLRLCYESLCILVIFMHRFLHQFTWKRLYLKGNTKFRCQATISNIMKYNAVRLSGSMVWQNKSPLILSRQKQSFSDSRLFTEPKNLYLWTLYKPNELKPEYDYLLSF